MKDFAEYKSLEECVVDLIKEDYFRRNKRILTLFPNLPASKAPRQDYVELFKKKIVEKIATYGAGQGRISANTLRHSLRGDNHADEYKIAIRRLIEERKIVETKLQTGKIGRPTIEYTLWEF